jgi:SAM-dependent methyltransferase
MQPIARQRAYYDDRWEASQHANLYGLERCLFILRGLRDSGLKEPKICDLGCGSGWLSGILSAWGPTVGIDLSPKAVERAQRCYPTAQFICADATQWKPEADAYDVVVSQEVIEHVEDKAAYLKVANRALRFGGYFFVTTPNVDVLNAIPLEVRRAIWEIQPVELPLNLRQLLELLGESGFEVLNAGSVITRCGTLGWQRLLNSHKLNVFLSICGLEKAWQWYLRRANFGMYLTVIARKQHVVHGTSSMGTLDLSVQFQ